MLGCDPANLNHQDEKHLTNQFWFGDSETLSVPGFEVWLPGQVQQPGEAGDQAGQQAGRPQHAGWCAAGLDITSLICRTDM